MATRDENETVELEVDLIADPPDAKAFLVRIGSGQKIWVPRSISEIELISGKLHSLKVPVWFAEKEGMI